LRGSVYRGIKNYVLTEPNDDTHNAEGYAHGPESSDERDERREESESEEKVPMGTVFGDMFL